MVSLSGLGIARKTGGVVGTHQNHHIEKVPEQGLGRSHSRFENHCPGPAFEGESAEILNYQRIDQRLEGLALVLVRENHRQVLEGNVQDLFDFLLEPRQALVESLGAGIGVVDRIALGSEKGTERGFAGAYKAGDKDSLHRTTVSKHSQTWGLTFQSSREPGKPSAFTTHLPPLEAAKSA